MHRALHHKGACPHHKDAQELEQQLGSLLVLQLVHRLVLLLGSQWAHQSVLLLVHRLVPLLAYLLGSLSALVSPDRHCRSSSHRGFGIHIQHCTHNDSSDNARSSCTPFDCCRQG